MKTAIVTDSGSGLNKQQADALGIYYLPLQIIVNDNMYLDGVDIQVEQIYEMVKCRQHQCRQWESLKNYSIN